MANKGLIGLHWLSLIWLIIILILVSVSLHQINQAQKLEDPTEKISTVQHLNITAVVFVSVILLPLIYWIWKQSNAGFSSEMVDISF